jgi:hypothetical protein
LLALFFSTEEGHSEVGGLISFRRHGEQEIFFVVHLSYYHRKDQKSKE